VNLNQLRVFSAVAEASSITGGAELLKISQPAASKQLAELEASVGTLLVERRPRGIQLTAAGELLRRHARQIFGAEREAEEQLADLLALRSGRIAIGASTTIGSYLVPPLYAAFSREYPQVDLSLDIANTARIQTAVVDGEVDFGLTEGFVRSDALDVEVFARDEMVLIASTDSRAFPDTEIEVAALQTLPVILRERGSGTRDVIEASLAARDIRITPRLELGSTEAVKRAVAEGLGLALVSSLSVELELGVGHLRQIRMRDHAIRRALHLVTRRGKQQSPAALAFLARIRTERPRSSRNRTSKR
jgi:DNA-binding transcriptional LysR family regulator